MAGVEAEAPEAGVVVASFCGERALLRCLESLEGESSRCDILAVTDASKEAVARLRARFPAVRILEAPPGASVFRMRSLGIGSVGASFVALLEDHCTVEPGWLGSLLSAHRAGHAVVGGTVENGLPPGIYSRALFLCEYAAHMPPLADGPAASLTGINVGYAAEVLASCRETWSEAFYENEVHDALAARGERLHRCELARVKSHLSFRFGQAIGHLFRGGRRFGDYRASRSSALVRTLLPGAAVVVPALLTWRILRVVATRQPTRLLASLMGL